MTLPLHASRLFLAGCALVLISSCATEPAPMGSRFVVTTPFAEFYKNGPAQDIGFADHTFSNYLASQYTGPDFQLPKGAAVTMLKRENGFSKVVTDQGVAGYVANEQLKPAPAVAAARSAPTEMRNDRIIRQRARALPPPRKNDEQLDFSDLPLPLPS